MANILPKSEINIVMENLNISGICLCCLNSDRKLFNNEKAVECYKLLGRIYIPDKMSIQLCCECVVLLQKVTDLQNQVQHSYKVLSDFASKGSDLSIIQSMAVHRLERTQLFLFECVEEQQPEINIVENEAFTETDIEFKVEIEENPISTEIITEAPLDVNTTPEFSIKTEPNAQTCPLYSDVEDLVSDNEDIISEYEGAVSQTKTIRESFAFQKTVLPRKEYTKLGCNSQMMHRPSTSIGSRKRKRKKSDHDDEHVDPSFTLQSENESYSEQSESEENENKALLIPLRSEKHFFYGKNGFEWSKNPVCTSLNRITDIPQRQPKFLSSESLWNELFSVEMIDKIVCHTNEKLSQACDIKSRHREKILLKPTDREEIKAVLGLLFYTSVFKNNHENFKYTFATDGTARDIFRCVLSQQRFVALLTYIRFDDSKTRSERLKTNPLAPISDIFEDFFSNCKIAFSPGPFLRLNDLLVPYSGSCDFTVFLSNSHSRYGLKITLLVDSETSYVCNAYIYNGLSEKETKESPTQSVLHLCKDFVNSNRNISADKQFTSIELMEHLKNKGLTFLGALKNSDKHIPQELLDFKTRKAGTSKFGFTEDYTILSYVPEDSKPVLLVSSLHHTAVVNLDTKEPLMVTDYNRTKLGVEQLNEKLSYYSSQRRTSRWFHAIFFKLLDISGINAYVLYQQCEAPDIPRKIFLQDLARSLVLPQLKRRVYEILLPRELKLSIERILGKDMPPESTKPCIQESPLEKKTCSICPSRLRRRSKYICIACCKPICMGCSKKMCIDCAGIY